MNCIDMRIFLFRHLLSPLLASRLFRNCCLDGVTVTLNNRPTQRIRIPIVRWMAVVGTAYSCCLDICRWLAIAIPIRLQPDGGRVIKHRGSSLSPQQLAGVAHRLYCAIFGPCAQGKHTTKHASIGLGANIDLDGAACAYIASPTAKQLSRTVAKADPHSTSFITSPKLDS
jgi:hypothetical protein